MTAVLPRRGSLDADTQAGVRTQGEAWPSASRGGGPREKPILPNCGPPVCGPFLSADNCRERTHPVVQGCPWRQGWCRFFPGGPAVPPAPAGRTLASDWQVGRFTFLNILGYVTASSKVGFRLLQVLLLPPMCPRASRFSSLGLRSLKGKMGIIEQWQLPPWLLGGFKGMTTTSECLACCACSASARQVIAEFSACWAVNSQWVGMSLVSSPMPGP